MSSSHYHHVGIVSFVDKALITDTVSKLTRFLSSKGISICVESETFFDETIENLNLCSRTDMREMCDLIVVVGGDGSLLFAARDFADSDIPILGVNRGRLGFLTDIAPSELEDRVADVLSGNYVATRRFLLEAELVRDGEVIAENIALNDVVMQPTGSIRMIEFSLKIDDQYVYTQRSDGLIISTPTGSTAYALSGGGSIVHPTLEAINLVPINPHTLSNRPIIVNANSEIKVKIEEHNAVDTQVVCDGQIYMYAERGDIVCVRRKAKGIKLLHPVEHDFYATCRSKLKWANE